MLWEIDLHPREGLPDRDAAGVVADAAALGFGENLTMASARGFLVEGPALDQAAVDRLARELFSDPVVEEYVAAAVNDARLVAAQDLPDLDECAFELGVRARGVVLRTDLDLEVGVGAVVLDVPAHVREPGRELGLGGHRRVHERVPRPDADDGDALPFVQRWGDALLPLE